MASENLWGSRTEFEAVKIPRAILNDQARLLGELSMGLLLGRVIQDKHPAYDFSCKMEVVAPALDNYSHEVLVIRQGKKPFPVVVESQHLGSSQTCVDDTEFRECIREILSSEEVHAVLATLLSQLN